MSSTTSIHELPVDPAGGSNQSNVQLTANEPMNVPIPSQQPGLPQMAPQPPIPQQGPPEPQVSAGVPQTLDRESINSIVTGLQQASAAGVTQLMSRDMPTSSDHIVNDHQVDVNYVPPVDENHDNYLDREEDDEDIMNAYNKKVSKENQFDKLYDDLQTPLMLAILFFIFQLPFLKKQLFLLIPALFMNDGNYNLYGFLVVSILFAVSYQLITKSLDLFNTF